MKPLKNKFFLFVFVLLSISTHAQVDLDSLWGVWIDNDKEDTTRLEAIYKFASDGYLYNQPDSALYFAQLMFDFALEGGNRFYQANAFYLKGDVNFNQENFVGALKNYNSALNIYEDIDDKMHISSALLQIGNICYQNDNYPQALSYWINSLGICEEIGGNMSSPVLNNIGLIYKIQGDYPKALEFYKRSLAMFEEDESKMGISITLGNIGEIYSEQGNFHEALKYLNRSLKISEEIQHDNRITVALASLGDVYCKQGAYTKAMDYYKHSLRISEERNTNWSVTRSLLGIGTIYNLTHKEKLAIEWCKKGLIVAQESHSMRNQRSACKCLYDAYKALDNSSQSLKYLERLLILDDSLKMEETSMKLQQMEFARQMLTDSLAHVESEHQLEMAHQVELGKKDRAKTIFLVSGLIILLIAGGLWSRMHFIRKANTRLKIEKDRAEQSEQFKQQFLANMSHEIRTPMNAIRGMTDIILRRNPKKDQLTYLNAIKESSNSLLLIINDILDLSKIEAGKVDFEHIQFSLDHILNNVKTIMGLRAEEKSLILKIEKSEDVPDLLFGDPNRLSQVLINLVGNAIKFTEKGSICVRVESGDDIIGTYKMIRFTIEDTGIGVDQDRLDKIFRAFEQAYSDTLRKYGGTGLGLAISKELVELQGGQISAESEKDKGSKFSFELPLMVDETISKKLAESDTEERTNISGKLKGTSILLVEDNEFNIMVAKEELEDAIPDVKVLVAKNGKEAIDILEKEEIEIVLMDLQMPVMNGFEATTHIRNLNHKKAEVPIIAMTANVMKEEVERCINSGMNDYISKPFETKDLLIKIGQLT